MDCLCATLLIFCFNLPAFFFRFVRLSSSKQEASRKVQWLDLFNFGRKRFVLDNMDGFVLVTLGIDERSISIEQKYLQSFDSARRNLDSVL